VGCVKCDGITRMAALTYFVLVVIVSVLLFVLSAGGSERVSMFVATLCQLSILVTFLQTTTVIAKIDIEVSARPASGRGQGERREGRPHLSASQLSSTTCAQCSSCSYSLL